MDWKRETINDLRELRYLESYVSNYPSTLAELNAKLTAVRGASTDGEPSGRTSSSRVEDMWVGVIVKKERITWNYDAAYKKLERLKKALNLLSNDEQLVLTFFYVERRHNYLQALTERLHVERSQVYRMKDEALRKLTISLYGVCED